MVAVVLLSKHSPSPLSLELEKCGYKVYEAVNLTDFAGLCDYLQPAAVVISRDFNVTAIGDLAERHIVIEQHEDCTAEQVVDTLKMMFGDPARKQ